MGTSRTKPKRCETCTFYKASDMRGQGWCTHPKRQQSGGLLLLVRANALDCRNSWGEDFWTPRNASVADSQGRPDGPATIPTNDAGAVPAAAADDVVIHHTSLTKGDRAAMTTTSQKSRDEDDSINHAALSDQEDRAHVMARGAREAILRARERKKERLGLARQPQVAPLPAADAAAGDWAPHDDEQDDTVLGVRHRAADAAAIDPFRRSYNDPAPPVPSRELPAAAREMVARDQDDDRFDTVPEVRAGFALPRPAHFAAAPTGNDVTADIEDDDGQLPENPALSSYDRVLQRARRFQRLSGTRSPQRTVRPRADTTGVMSSAPPPADDMVDCESPDADAGADRRDDPRMLPDRASDLDDGLDDTGDDARTQAAVDETVWDDEIDPFPESEDAPWMALDAMTTDRRDQARPRFRLPHLSFWRHDSQAGTNPRTFAAHGDAPYDDDIVEQTSWPHDEHVAAETQDVDDDPDWADDMIPVESYAAMQPGLAPADVSAEVSGEVGWDDAWDAQPTAADEWADETVEELAEEDVVDDFVTGEATVPHRTLPKAQALDLASLRARLFPQRPSPRHDRPEPPDDVAARPVVDPAPLTAHSTGTVPDDDPDLGPGAGFAATLPGLDDLPSPAAPDDAFDLRAVIRRQDELLDMRIQIAPEVPRMCATCRNFRPADGGERGWCTNEWAFTHRRMVNDDDLPCESSIGCWWLPNDQTWLPEDDLAALTQPTPYLDRLLGRLQRPRGRERHQEPLRAMAR